MAAPSRMERQGQGKVGMANESESLVEAALGRAWATADAQAFEQETAIDWLTGADTRCSRSREDA